MKSRHPIAHGVLALSLSLSAVLAEADDDCDVPIQRWQSRDAALRMAAERGWQVQRLKIDDGCYEIRGTDAGGRRFKAKINPQTLEPVEMKVRDHDPNSDRDRDRERSRSNETGAAQPSADAATSGANPSMVPGTAPGGRTE